jgi:hypothetical protein
MAFRYSSLRDHGSAMGSLHGDARVCASRGIRRGRSGPGRLRRNSLRRRRRPHRADCRSGNLRVNRDWSSHRAAMGPPARALFHGASRDEPSRIRDCVSSTSICMAYSARNGDAGSDDGPDHALPVDSRQRFDFRRTSIIATRSAHPSFAKPYITHALKSGCERIRGIERDVLTGRRRRESRC